MKSAHRFDYARFGEALVERGLLDRNVLNHVLHQCNATRSLLTELLVRENLVSDWELGRVACELYHLPFLTVDQYPPSATALDGYDIGYLRHYALVPLDRFGGLVTVAMPGLVSSEVLEGLRPGQNGRVLAVVGSVVSNRRWLEERFAPAAAPAAKSAAGAKGGATPLKTISMALPQSGQAQPEVPGAIPAAELEEAQALQLGNAEDWGSLFDAGEEAVQLDLKKPRRP
ncbi:MAG: hypothetical protein ABL998_01170 [Planctomycetota bacterium]